MPSNSMKRYREGSRTSSIRTLELKGAGTSIFLVWTSFFRLMLYLANAFSTTFNFFVFFNCTEEILFGGGFIQFVLFSRVMGHDECRKIGKGFI